MEAQDFAKLMRIHQMQQEQSVAGMQTMLLEVRKLSSKQNLAAILKKWPSAIICTCGLQQQSTLQKIQHEVAHQQNLLTEAKEKEASLHSELAESKHMLQQKQKEASQTEADIQKTKQSHFDESQKAQASSLSNSGANQMC